MGAQKNEPLGAKEELAMTHKRLTLFAGHYGSGKTNIALNYARWLRRQGDFALRIRKMPPIRHHQDSVRRGGTL